MILLVSIRLEILLPCKPNNASSRSKRLKIPHTVELCLHNCSTFRKEYFDNNAGPESQPWGSHPDHLGKRYFKKKYIKNNN